MPTHSFSTLTLPPPSKTVTDTRIPFDTPSQSTAIRISHFSTAPDNLLFLRLNIHGHPATALVDSGATHNLIASTFTSLTSHTLLDKDIPATLELADGQEIHVTKHALLALELPATTDHRGITEELDMDVAPLAHADVILGKPWLDKHNPRIDWPNNRIIGFGASSPDNFTSKPMVTHDAQGSQPRGPHEPLEPPEPPEPLDTPEPLNHPAKPRISCATISRHALSKAKSTGQLFLALVRPAAVQEDATTLETIPDTSTSPLNISPPGLQELLSQFSDVFPENLPDGLPSPRTVDHRINELPGSSPVNGPIYRLSQAELEALRNYLTTEIDSGRIQPSTSPYGSPILFVKKKDGSLRPCIDYRALNKQTIKDRYPLPNIDELLDRLGHAKYFSKIDLKSGYNQVRIHPDDIPKTAFKTRYGQFEYLVMPFGLTNAPATFQRLMNNLLHDHLDNFVIVYLDDILIFSRTQEEHLRHLQTVLRILKDNKLYAAAKKCAFFKTEIEYLGYLVSANGIRMDPTKVASITNWPTPTSVHDIQSFLGLANFYRRFIKDFSHITRPITALLAKDTPFDWNADCAKAFSTLKTAFTTAPVLRIFCPGLPLRVTTDASGSALGAVLEQNFDGKWHPIAFESRKLSPAEKNYPTHEQELLAIVHALRTWRIFLEGSGRFDVWTDHHALRYFQTQRNLSRRQARWSELLCNFDFEIKYKPGSTNHVADAQSRRPDLLCLARLLPGRPYLTSVTDHRRRLNNISSITTDLFSQFLHAQNSDPDLKQFVRHLKDTTLPPPTRFRSQLQHFSLDPQGHIRFKKKYFVPDPLRSLVIQEHHAPHLAGHLGQDKTADLVRRHYYWPNQDTDIRRFVHQCDTCQRIKTPAHKPHGLLQPLPPPSRPWESISIDFITDLPKCHGYDSIMVVVDRFTKMVHCLPCTKTNIKDDKAPQVAKLFLHIISLHGIPSSIISDRDPRFTSNFWRQLSSLCGTELKMSTAYHPQTDGQTERTNRTLEQVLRAYCTYEQDNWVDLLPFATFAINNAEQSSTKTTPFFANYGFHPRIPTTPPVETTVTNPAAMSYTQNLAQVHHHITKNLETAQARQTRYANRLRSQIGFKKGDYVMLSTKNLKLKRPSAKLDHKFLGPFPIDAIINPVAVRLSLPPSMARLHPVFHVSLLEPYHGPLQRKKPPAPVIIDDELEYEVERLLDCRGTGENRQYLVKWTGYPIWEATWEPIANLDHAKDLVTKYDCQNPTESRGASRTKRSKGRTM